MVGRILGWGGALLRAWRVWTGILLLIIAVAGAPWVGAARDHNARVLESAVGAYAALRAINASLSVAKETTIGVELFGSVEGKPAMVLDPVDETVARISDALFALAAVSAVLAVGLAPAAQIGAGVAGAGFLVLAASRRAGLATGGAAWGGLHRAVRLGLFLGLLLPIGCAGGGWLGEVATEARLEAALDRLRGQEAEINASVAALAAEVGRPAPEAVPDARPAPDRNGEAGVMDRVFGNMGAVAGSAMEAGREAVEGLRRQADGVREAVPDMAQVQARGGAIVESGLALLAIYTVRLVVFPLLTLAFLWVFLRRTSA